MHRLFVVILGLLSCTIVQSQPNDYFQQRVNYKIEVTLNDKAHQLSGSIQIAYINNAPDTLTEIYLHLWANAFQTQKSTYARQALRMGDTRFHFADTSTYGGYKYLDFNTNQEKIRWDYWHGHPDIARLELATPLAPGDSLLIQTPFLLKIPASFSRLGRVGESYQITQWYPKPAVYDRDGWHPMPYLDIGEYYSEFGSFEVAIRLPANYTVAATGTLQTPEEQHYLAHLAAQTQDILSNQALMPEAEAFPASSDSLKTIRFTAEQVHDFAWFADKRFMLQKATVRLANGDSVLTQVFFTRTESELWKDALDYVNRAVQFYSEEVGSYPYPHATAVQSALSAGAGMEYPMITVIGLAGDALSLDEVITHEVGHNWFYGILGTNERDQAWMDEGINTFYEQRYMQKYYPGYQAGLLPAFLLNQTQLKETEISYLFQARRGKAQPIATTSDSLTAINYWLNAYDRPAFLFQYLEAYLGSEVFLSCMQSFYQKWKFKHPLPQDLQVHLEAATGKDLNWFFQGLITSNAKMDYKIMREKSGQVTIKNRGTIAAPFPITGISKDSIIPIQWEEGFLGKKVLEIPILSSTHIRIDPEHLTYDYNRKNNHYSLKSLFKKMGPPVPRLFPGLPNSRISEVNLTPLVGWNPYSKISAGVLINNLQLLNRNFEYGIGPMLSVESGTLQVYGLTFFQYSAYPEKGPIGRWQLGFGARRFSFDRLEGYADRLSYGQFTPRFRLDFRAHPIQTTTHSIRLEASLVEYDLPLYNAEGNLEDLLYPDISQIQLTYHLRDRSILQPVQLDLGLTYGKYDNFFADERFLKAEARYNIHFLYRPQKKIRARLFAGAFLYRSRTPGLNFLPYAFDLTDQGWNDFAFADLFIGRSEQSGIWSQQIHPREGGFKNAFGPGIRTGRANDVMVTLNLSADLPMDLPLHLPLQPYVDMAYLQGGDDTFLFSGGLQLDFFDQRLAVYFPLVHSKAIRNTYKSLEKNFGNRITFTLDLNRLDPLKLREEAPW